MYKNTTYYDLDLIMLSQKSMVKQTKIVASIFAFVLLVLAVVSFVLKKTTVGITLSIVSAITIIVFIGLSGTMLKATMKKNLKNRQITIEYMFANNLTITSKVDGAVTTQSFEYNNIFQIVETDKCLVICPSKNDALIMRIDDKYAEYRQFVMDKMQNRYVVQKSKNKQQ